MIVAHGLLLPDLRVGPAKTLHLRRRGVLLPGKLGKILPDCLLKRRRFPLVDGQNRGKPKLADHLVGGGIGINRSGMFGKQHGTKAPFFNVVLIIVLSRKKVNQR
ncbi:hypothetical protein SDC9_169597 [bioreactor metagenome]|uniref:Uncharacterized protein n=1 Tax=bioreactor metagenome TaxID=1076179 RepID=A0A645GDY1_9ZZZZ